MPKDPINHMMLKELKQSQQDLIVATDELGEAIKAVNTFLKQLNLGVSGWVDVAASAKSRRRLGYTKIGKEWGLAIRIEYVDPLDIEEWSILQGPRWLRVEALVRLPQLFEHLVEQSKDLATRSRSRAKEVHELLAVLAAQEIEVTDGQNNES